MMEPMTVGQLIEKLKGFDPNLRAVTPGFDESGIDDIKVVELADVIFNDHITKGSHSGRHDSVEHYHSDGKMANATTAVLINW